jgi:hypothetical protein
MDTNGNKDAKTRQLLSLVKAHVPITVQTIIDRCIQAHGAMGTCQDTPLYQCFAAARCLRIADGPDEVHWRTAARLELRMQEHSPLKDIGYYHSVDLSKPFRRSTDPVSKDAQAVVDIVSRL